MLAIDRPAAPGVAVARDEVLDFVKGTLVVVMVVYHWLNYFVVFDWDVYRYLRFLTPSFILITGYLVSRVYLAKYAYDSPQLRRRLVARGAKLIALFVVLNVLINAVSGHRESQSLAEQATAVFLTGTKAAAFNILVPIGYFLVLAPFILLVAARSGVSLAWIAGATLTTSLLANAAGLRNDNVEMLTIALVGLGLGASARRIEPAMKHPLPLMLGYTLYVAAITVWNVLFPLQVIGVCLSVGLIYIAGTAWSTRDAIHRSIIELGKYSLFAYVAQIAVLQVFRRAAGDDLSGALMLVAFVVGLFGTLASVQVMGTLRARFAMADRLYRTVFA